MQWGEAAEVGVGWEGKRRMGFTDKNNAKKGAFWRFNGENWKKGMFLEGVSG